MAKFSSEAKLGPVDPTAKIPVRIEEDLNVTAQSLGTIFTDEEIFRQNGRVIFFDSFGERQEMTPVRFKSWVNKRVVVYQKCAKDSPRPLPSMLTNNAAETILEDGDFLKRIRPLRGMNSVRLPVLRAEGRLELLPYGYDAETGIMTVEGGVEYETGMDLEAAKAWLGRMFGGFPLTDPRSMAVMVASLLALYVRHLPGGTGLRPGFLWLANKPGSGKSVLAKAAQYPVLGRAPAVKMKKGEQLDKEMEAFMIAGVPALFLDNVYGGIESPTIDQMLTSEESEGRAMGGHGLFRAANSALLFVTGNRLELNADAARRFLVVDLFEKGEPKERVVDREWLLNDGVMKSAEWRARMLAICWAFVRNWHEKGMPEGSITFPSFENYGWLIGGIVEAAGYESPFQEPEIPDAINPEKLEFMELMEEVLMEMGLDEERDFTLENLAMLARRRQVFEKSVGTEEEGRRLRIKMDKIDREHHGVATDCGYMTPPQSASFGKRIKKLAGGELKVKGRSIEFGKRAQARKSTFTVKILS